MMLHRCDLVKIDVEGMELDVLQGGVATVRKFKPLLYVENDHFSEKTVRFIMQTLKYTCYWHTPPIFNKGNFRGSKENIWHMNSNENEDRASLNLLCVTAEIPTKTRKFLKSLRKELSSELHSWTKEAQVETLNKKI